MRGVRILVGLIAIGVIAAACSAPQKSAKPSASASPPPPPAIAVAFVSKGTIFLADTAGKVRDTGVSTKADELLWSPDGSRLAWLDGSDDGLAGQVHLLDVKSGRVISKPCPCNGLAYLGDRLTTLSADSAALVQFTPALEATSIPVSPPLKGGGEVVVGGRDRVVVAVGVPEAEQQFRGQSRLFGIDIRGKAVSVLKPKLFASFGYALPDPSGLQFASIDNPSGGACVGAQTVSTYRQDGVGTSIDVSLPNDLPYRLGTFRDSDRMIRSVSWTRKGLVVTFSPVHCSVSYPFRYVTYLKQGHNWTYLGTGWLAAAYGEGRTYRLKATTFTVTDGFTNDPTGTLVLSTGTKQPIELGKNVSAFWLTPAETAKSTPPTPAALPVYPSVPSTTYDGKPVPRAAYVLATQIAKALDKGSVSELTALCRGCTPERLQMMQDPTTRAEMRKALMAHAADHGGFIDFPGLAGTPCSDGAGNKDVCTAEQMQDIGRIGVPGEVELEVKGLSYRMSPDVRVTIRLNKDGTATWSEWPG